MDVQISNVQMWECDLQIINVRILDVQMCRFQMCGCFDF